MTTYAPTGAPLSVRGLLISLREAFDAHTARVMEPDATTVPADLAGTRRAGFSFRLLGDVRHTI